MEQFDIFNTNNHQNEYINITNGEYLYFPSYFEKKESNSFLRSLIKEIIWKQEKMNIYGKSIKFPRLTAWYGDDERSYKFSGITLYPNKWTPLIVNIKERVESQIGTKFNSVLLNFYKNGNDSISWHSDAEEELGKNPIIASVSFGEKRLFQLKHNISKQKREIELQNGSLLVMKGELQHYWKHQLPKTRHKKRERVNLTFRLLN
jgi:alkylated DNA repair dioxygenase AlkB